MKGTGVESSGLFEGTMGARAMGAHAMGEESVKDEVESDAFKAAMREAGRQFAIGFMEAAGGNAESTIPYCQFCVNAKPRIFKSEI
ncbi:MAG: hypothetical protein E7317_11025 [Clostridiales bacterium]|nr:hypothetical protein [Clostridiales bacterium]